MPITDAELLTALKGIVGVSAILVEADDVAPFLVDWRGAYHGRAACVVLPSSVEQTQAVVRLLGEARRPLVPQAGNTSVCGGATPDGSGRQVVVSLRRLDRIRRVDPFDNLLVAEAGCVLADVQRAAEEVERLFPLSLGAEGSAQIGGLLSTNAGGTAVLRYGMMRDLVLGVEAVLPTGELFQGLRSLRKDNTGYDLKQLFIGAEGTLGLVTAAALKLFPRPRETVTAMVALPDTSSAVKLLRQLQDDAGDNVVTFELIGDAAFRMLLAQMPQLACPFPTVPPAAALVEVTSSWRDFSARDAFEASLARASEQGLVLDAVVARGDRDAEALWQLREQVSEAEARAGASVKHDISVTPGRIPAFLVEVEHAVRAAFPGAEVVVYGHLGDGSLHLNVVPRDLVGPKVPAELHARVWRLVHDLVAAHDGSISAEHGIGQLKRDELWRYRAAVDRRLMTGIKALFDPAGLMNPDKLL